MAACPKRETIKYNLWLHTEIAEWRERYESTSENVYSVFEQGWGKGWLRGFLCVYRVFTSLFKLQV